MQCWIAKCRHAFWGKVSIDKSVRTAAYCALSPTEALSNEDNNEEHATPLLNRPRASEIVHEFRCSDCIQCHPAEDVCPTAGALHVSDKNVNQSELFDQRPILIASSHDDALTQGEIHAYQLQPK